METSLTGRRAAALAVVALAAASALVPLDPWLVERWFTSGIYPHIQRALTGASNLIPIAWLDVVGAAAIAWVVWTWTRAIRHAPHTGRLRPLGGAAARTLVAAAVAYLLFLGLWGFNYRRVPMLHRLETASQAPTSDAVTRLAAEAASRVNALYGSAHTSGWPEPVWRDEALRRAFADVQRSLADTAAARPARLKRSVLAPVFRWTSVDGMINPFGLEVLVNPDLLPFERPFVAAHEWAHLAGYADEAEANFVGWLTCLRGDVTAQYSGWLYLYWQVSGELQPRERERIGQQLAGGPRRDLAAIAARLRRGDVPALRRASWLMYDRYLKANRVEAGVRSYGAVVTLILRARFEDGWRPVRRAASARPSP